MADVIDPFSMWRQDGRIDGFRVFICECGMRLRYRVGSNTSARRVVTTHTDRCAIYRQYNERGGTRGIRFVPMPHPEDCQCDYHANGLEPPRHYEEDIDPDFYDEGYDSGYDDGSDYEPQF